MEINKTTVLKNQYIYAVITKFIIVAISFLNSVLIARYLGADLKGMAATTINAANIISTVITLGLNEAYPLFRKKKESASYLSEYMTVVIAIFGAYLLITTGVLFFLHSRIEIVCCAYISILMGYATIVNYIALVEEPNHRNKVMVWMYVIDVAILAFLYIFVPANYYIAIFVSSFIYIAQAVYYSIDLKYTVNLQLISAEHIITYVKFGCIPMLMALLTTVNYRVDVVMLRMNPSISYTEIGIYSIGVSLAEKVFLVPNAVKEVLLSKLAKGKNEDEVCKVIRICWPICMLTTIGIAVLGRPFINLFYGSDYSDSYSVTVVCLLGTVFMLFFKMILTYTIVNGKQKASMCMLCCSDAVNVFLNAVLIPEYGIMGAAFASDVSYFICAWIFVTYFSRSNNIKFRDILIIKKSDIEAMVAGFNAKG